MEKKTTILTIRNWWRNKGKNGGSLSQTTHLGVLVCEVKLTKSFKTEQKLGGCNV